MKVITGTVVGGKVEVPGDVVTEGEHVVILVPGEEEPIQLSDEEEQELFEAMEEIRRGEYVDGADLLEEIRSRSRG